MRNKERKEECPFPLSPLSTRSSLSCPGLPQLLSRPPTDLEPPLPAACLPTSSRRYRRPAGCGSRSGSMGTMSVHQGSRAPPQPGRRGWFAGIRIATSATPCAAAPPHTVAESTVQYILSALPAVLAFLPSVYLLRQGDIAVTIQYFSAPSLYISIANSIVWMFYDIIVAKDSSFGTLLCNGLIVSANFHILAAYFAAKDMKRKGYALVGFIAACLMIILAVAKWSFQIPYSVQVIFAAASIGTLLLSHALQICDIFRAPSDNFTREIAAATIAPSFVFNLLSYVMNNTWHRDRVLEQVAGGIGALFCFLEMFLLIVLKGPDMDAFASRDEENNISVAPFDPQEKRRERGKRDIMLCTVSTSDPQEKRRERGKRESERITYERVRVNCEAELRQRKVEREEREEKEAKEQAEERNAVSVSLVSCDHQFQQQVAVREPLTRAPPSLKEMRETGKRERKRKKVEEKEPVEKEPAQEWGRRDGGAGWEGPGGGNDLMGVLVVNPKIAQHWHHDLMGAAQGIQMDAGLNAQQMQHAMEDLEEPQENKGDAWFDGHDQHNDQHGGENVPVNPVPQHPDQPQDTVFSAQYLCANEEEAAIEKLGFGQSCTRLFPAIAVPAGGHFPDAFPADENPVPADGNPHPVQGAPVNSNIVQHWRHEMGAAQGIQMDAGHAQQMQNAMEEPQENEGDAWFDGGHDYQDNDQHGGENVPVNPVPQHPDQPQDTVSDQSGTAQYLCANGPDLVLQVEDVLAGKYGSSDPPSSSTSSGMEVHSPPCVAFQVEQRALSILKAWPVPRSILPQNVYKAPQDLAIVPYRPSLHAVLIKIWADDEQIPGHIPNDDVPHDGNDHLKMIS